jgi:hypothetical protein
MQWKRVFDCRVNNMFRIIPMAVIGHDMSDIEFPQSKARDDRIGPIWEAGQLEGMIVAIGGKGDTKHIRLADQDGEVYKLSTTNIELAKQFGNQLFADVRVTGSKKWFLEENNEWTLDDFVVQSCDPLDNTSLIEAVAALRAIEGDGWKKFADPLAICRQLRG